jgi:CPA2 family monovalent cation:H+ antiporter-2
MNLLVQAFIYLGAAVVAVPLAKRLGLGSVLGYLIAGMVIGPLFGLVGGETTEVQHFAEFGVVMMLFLVGLELQPRELWQMRHRLLGLGGLQVGLTAAVVALLAIGLGTDWKVGLAIGLIAAGSSTAIVLQTLSEKGLLQSDGGKASFSVLLFQDIAVIPILALLPLLAMSQTAAPAEAGQEHAEQAVTLIAGLPGWAAAGVTVLAVAAVVVGGHYLANPLFRYIASSRLREAFTAAALLLVIGIALLMTLVGLSPALGTFLAGVVLANSEYRHELESDIEPFKGLLLGLFFITVGAGINFGLLFAQFLPIVGMTLILIAVKGAVLWGIGSAFRLRGTDRWLMALGLAQTGEFAFVLLSFTVQNSIITPELEGLLLLVVALSMLLTPLLFIFFDRVIVPYATRSQQREADPIDAQGVAVIAGIGRFGQVVNRILRSSAYETVVVDLSADTIETMGRFGIRAYYGDASRPDLLEAAGLMQAGLLVVAIDDREKALAIVKYAKQVRPDLHVVSRAYDRLHVYDLFAAKCDTIIRETFDSAVRAGRNGLEALGTHPYEAEKIVQMFTKSDRHTLLKLAELHDPEIPPTENEPYVAMAKQMRIEEEGLGAASRGISRAAIDKAWSPPGG